MYLNLKKKIRLPSLNYKKKNSLIFKFNRVALVINELFKYYQTLVSHNVCKTF